jgi:hypothetical protein
VVGNCGRDDRDDNQGVILHRVAPEGGSPMEAAEYFTQMGIDLS